MSVSSTQYIHTIDRSAITPSLDEEFDVPFAISDATELIVWTIVDTLLVRKYIGRDYFLLGDKVVWNGLAPSEDMRFQRHVKYDQPGRFETTVPESIEDGLDQLCHKGHQILSADTLSPRNFSCEDDRLTSLTNDTTATPSATSAVNKKYVDDALPDVSGTNSYYLNDATDVGKFLKTNTAPAVPSWVNISGFDDPKGEEGNYLTEAGWTGFGIIPVASDDANKVLKDVSGVPTWTAISELPSENQSYGRILSRENADPSAIPSVELHSKWRNSGQTPTPYGQAWDCASKTDDNTRYQWKGGYSITRDWAFGDALNPSGNEWAGVENASTGNSINAHTVWVFELDNPYERVPDYLGISIWNIFKDPYELIYPISGPPAYNFTFRHMVYNPEIANLVSIDATTITISVSTMRHAWVNVGRIYPGATPRDDPFLAKGNHTTTGYGEPLVDEAPYSRTPSRIFDLTWYFAS